MKFANLSVVVVCILGFFLVTNQALALTISPVKVEVTGDSGQTLRGEMEILNEQGEAKLFFSSFENFEPQGETGSPHFIGADGGLATWLQTEASITVNPGEKTVVPYTITIPEDAEPGGYFSAIFWGSQDPKTQDAGEVSIGGKLGVLILLRVSGEILEDAGVSEYKTDSDAFVFSSLPIGFSYKFTNNGADRVVPLGDIVIKNTINTVTATISANSNEGSVLPNSSRRFQSVWEGESQDSLGFFQMAKQQLTDFHFGLYSAELNLIYGSKNQEASETVRFLIIPWQLLGICVVALVLGFFALRQYNSWIISKSKKGN